MSVLRNGWLVVALVVLGGGCVKSEAVQTERPHFETEELDACLAVIVDMSGSFREQWDDQAYQLFLELMDRFFTEGMGGEARVVLGQLSGEGDIVLFEGSPAEVRQRFGSPEELNHFLHENSDTTGSHVFRATGTTVDYVAAMPGVTERTRLLTVILSDMIDSEQDAEIRRKVGHQMVASLKRYQKQGGGLAFYFMSSDRVVQWRQILEMAQFEAGQYVIQTEVVAEPQLPRFD